MYNGSRNSLAQMLSIDSYFMVYLISQGNSAMTIILGLTIAFCVLAFIICFWVVPYLFGIEITDLKALEFSLKVEKQHTKEIIDACDNFSLMLERNQYLNDGEEPKNRQIHQ
jgi:bacteriorhodopsin